MKYSQLQADDVKMEVEETKVTSIIDYVGDDTKLKIEEIASTELSGLKLIDIDFYVN